MDRGLHLEGQAVEECRRRVLGPLALKMELPSFETSVTIHQWTQCDIAHNLHLKKDRCENVRPRIHRTCYRNQQEIKQSMLAKCLE
jgi:hypothetical protein